jgi:hypothetical protein
MLGLLFSQPSGRKRFVDTAHFLWSDAGLDIILKNRPAI